jgi:D-alanyl-D-alanine carboxypeptidase
MRRPAGSAAAAVLAVLAAVALPGDAVLGWRPAAAAGAAYRLIELPSGRVIAEARQDILATPMAPGSLMKLASLVALAESGFDPDQVRLVCSRNAVVDGQAVPCVHPDLHRPLGAAEALGYS